MPSLALTSYGIELRLPIYEADGVTIAVLLCRGPNRHYFGLFLTRDSRGKDPTRPRYFTGCVVNKPDQAQGSGEFAARLADLGDDLYNPTLNGRAVKASWRTVYVVPTASNLDSGSSTTPNLVINRNPTSRFRIPRWLIARFTALQFTVVQSRNTEALQVLEIHLHGTVCIYLSLGSCVQHRDRDPSKPPQLWAKVDVLLLPVSFDTFAHDCSQDHLDCESWVTRSKVFGGADRAVRFSFTPSTRMPDTVLVVHLELLGRVLEKILRDSGDLSLFPSLADRESETLVPRLAPTYPAVSSPPSRTLSQIEPTST